MGRHGVRHPSVRDGDEKRHLRGGGGVLGWCDPLLLDSVFFYVVNVEPVVDDFSGGDDLGDVVFEENL